MAHEPFPKLVNDIVKKERVARRRFSSGSACKTWQLFRLSQDLLMGMLVQPAMQSGTQTHQQKAVLAEASFILRLTRSADLVITSGYPVQAASLVRGVYERVSTALKVRGDESLARHLLGEGLRYSEVKGFVHDWKNDVVPLIRFYLSHHPRSHETQAFDIDGFERNIAILYDKLSAFSHPGREALCTHFIKRSDDEKAVFALQPEGEATPHAEILLGYLCILQYVVCVLLAVDFAQPEEKLWRALVIELDDWAAAFAPQVRRINALRAGLMHALGNMGVL